MYVNYSTQNLGLLFEGYALDYSLTLNATYLSRDTSESRDTEIADHFKKLLAGERYSENIYTFPMEKNIPKKDYRLNYRVGNIVIGV